MARLQPLSARQSPRVRILDWLCRWRFGQPLTSVGLIARSPGLLIPYLMTNGLAHARVALPPETRVLVMHAVAMRNQCAWCIDFGLAEAARAELDLGKIGAVDQFATDPRFTAAERAALAYAAASMDGGHVDDPTFDALRPHFTEREIVELTVAIAIEHFFNRVNGPLGVAEQGFCRVPARSGPAALPTRGAA